MVGSDFAKSVLQFRAGARLGDYVLAHWHLRAGATVIDRVVGHRFVESILAADGLPLDRE